MGDAKEGDEEIIRDLEFGILIVFDDFNGFLNPGIL